MRVGAVLLHKPGRTLALVVFAGMLCGVVINALFFQTARHPAPIFHGPVIARPALHAAPPANLTAGASVPVPPQRIAEKPVAQPPQMAPAAPVAAQRSVEAAPKDQIGALLAGVGAGAPAAVVNADSARVMAAQKALVKLGYVVKADGVMGAGTRKAIEMFEASRKLPVTGELTLRVMRELSTLSGVAVP